MIIRLRAASTMVILVFFLVAGCTGEIQGVPEPDPGTLV